MPWYCVIKNQVQGQRIGTELEMTEAQASPFVSAGDLKLSDDQTSSRKSPAGGAARNADGTEFHTHAPSDAERGAAANFGRQGTPKVHEMTEADRIAESKRNK